MFARSLPYCPADRRRRSAFFTRVVYHDAGRRNRRLGQWWLKMHADSPNDLFVGDLISYLSFWFGIVVVATTV